MSFRKKAAIKLCKRNFTCFYLICKSLLIDVTTTFAVISWKKEVYRNMIADKIKNARTIKKLTQEQVAEDLNVSRQTISNWENGV